MKEKALGRTKVYFIVGAFLVFMTVVATRESTNDAYAVLFVLLGAFAWVMMFVNLTEAKGYPRAVGLVSLSILGALVLVFLPDKAKVAPNINWRDPGKPWSSPQPWQVQPGQNAAPVPATRQAVSKPVAGPALSPRQSQERVRQPVVRVWDCPECGNRNSAPSCIKCGYSVVEN
jgi:hypothetical protein